MKRDRLILLKGVVFWYGRNQFFGPGIAWIYAELGGGPVLKDQISWRKINGIVIRFRDSQLFLHFRRLNSLHSDVWAARR